MKKDFILNKAEITPHNISVILLYLKYSELRPRTWDIKDEDCSKEPPVINNLQRRTTSYLLFKLMQGGKLDLSILMNILKSAKLVKEHVAGFTHAIYEIYVSGIDSLLSLFESVDKCITQDQSQKENFPCINASLMGELSITENLDFTDCSKEVQNVCEDSLVNFDIRQLFDELERQDIDFVNGISGSRQQAEMFISRQALLLQVDDPSALKPSLLQQKIAQILRAYPDLSEAYFLSYLNCTRVKEWCGAIHSLTSYYDGQLNDKDISHLADSHTFRQASLSMTALHAYFGHREVASKFLQESIKLAQEGNDDKCLQHALAWLYTLSDTHKMTIKKRSYQRTCELPLPYLNWLALLNSLVEMLYTSAPPSQHLQMIQTMVGRPTGGSDIHSLARLWSVLAGLWNVWGSAMLSSLCGQLLLNMELNLSKFSKKSLAANPSCNVLCSLAMTFADMGESSLALEILQYARKRFPTVSFSSDLWAFTQSYLTFNSLMLRGCWRQSQNIISIIAATHPLESKYRYGLLLFARGEVSLALSLTQKLLELNDGSLTPQMEVQLLILQSEALTVSSCSWAALPLLVKALSICNRCHLAYLGALTRLHLANIQLQLRLYTEAKNNVQSGLHIILTGESLLDQARTNLLLSKIKARLYHEIGYFVERNRCAMEFRHFEENHPGGSFSPSSLIF